jgi:hypothetical protein
MKAQLTCVPGIVEIVFTDPWGAQVRSRCKSGVCEFAHPAEICAPHAPVRVLMRESQDQLPPLPFERRPPRLPVRTRPAARHEAPVAAQQRLRPHRECCPRPPRERPTHRGRQRAIGQLDSWPPRLPPQDRELVTPHQDLQRLRPIRAPDKQHERERMPEREVDARA